MTIVKDLEEVYLEFVELRERLLQDDINNQFIDEENNESKRNCCVWCEEENIVNLTHIEIGFVCKNCYEKFLLYEKYKRFKSKNKKKPKVENIRFVKKCK